MPTTFHYPESPYGRTYADVITKISGMDSLPNYLSYGAPLARKELLFYINTNEIPNHFTLIVFWCERRDLVSVAIAKVIFSHVKISSFRAKAPLPFHWCLYNKNSYLCVTFILFLCMTKRALP